jgi:hypothetical protein
MNDTHALVIANLVRTAVLLTLVGLLAKRRAHFCWAFTIYLIAVLAGNSMVSFWPERFFKSWFYILKESVYNVLMLCVAAELTYRVFQQFPGALARARLVLAPLMSLVTLAIISVPAGTDYVDIVTRYHPQIQTGVIWLLSATAVLTVWYNIPLHFVHRALLLGLSSYLIVFATLGNVLRSFGFDRLRSMIGMADAYAYFVLVSWLAFTAWRSGAPIEIAPVRTPVLAPKPA